MSSRYRTHYCAELNAKFINQQVKVAGFIRKKRNHGSIVFIDLVDGSGVLQCVCSVNSVLFEQLSRLSLETVVSFHGAIIKRQEGTINAALASGEVELEINEIEVLSASKELPFSLDQENLGEELQLKNRFLYLRRGDMQKMLKLRTQVLDLLRTYMKELGFLEVQTPIITSGSPEGARDYIVPSRLHPGKFYALPQAPQQFKQLLMASGVDRYFQIAPCFRDEDSRADRLLGEFYQLDFEMAFVEQEDVFQVLETVFTKLFKTIRPDRKIKPFPRIPYMEAIARYGSDKPDLRNPLELEDITAAPTPKIFELLVQSGGKLVIISAKTAGKTTKFYQQLQLTMQEYGAGGLAWSILENNEWRGPMSKMFDDTAKKSWLKPGHDTLFLIADKNAHKLAGHLRNELGEQLELIDKNTYEFCFITDFPMFEWDEAKQSWDFMHNPFSMPQDLSKEIGEILAFQYDIVCNGYELSSGAVRNHDLEKIRQVFEIVGQSVDDLEEKFPVFKAFKYGVPPHAGAAPGIDRIIMLLSDQKNVRNTVAFPLNQQGEDLLMLAPSLPTKELLEELCVTIKTSSK